MSYFGILMASLALVLVNLGIGWFVAKKYAGGQFDPTVRKLPDRDRTAE
jgi:hypothetical protein